MTVDAATTVEWASIDSSSSATTLKRSTRELRLVQRTTTSEYFDASGSARHFAKHFEKLSRIASNRDRAVDEGAADVVSGIETFHRIAGNASDVEVDQALRELAGKIREDLRSLIEEQPVKLAIGESSVDRAGSGAGALQQRTCRFDPRLSAAARTVGQTEVRRLRALHQMMNDELVTRVRDDDGEIAKHG